MNLIKFKMNAARADENKKKVVVNYIDNSLSKAISQVQDKVKEEDEEKVSIKDVLSSPESRSVVSRFPSKSDDKPLPYRRILSSGGDTLKTKADVNTNDTARQLDKLPNWMSKVLEEKNKHFSHRPSLTLSGNTISTNINGSLTGHNTQFKTGEALKVLRNKTNNNIYNNTSLGMHEANITNIEKEKSRNFLPDITAGKYYTTEPVHDKEKNQSVDQNEKLVLEYFKKGNKSNQNSNTTNLNENADFQNFNISDLQSLKDLKYFINKNNSNGQMENPIMNIVNNVNPKKTDKKYEINFNQYEIKIVPEKKKSSNEEENGTSSESQVVDKDLEKESANSKAEASFKKNLIKKLSMKTEKPIGSPTKIVINRALSKKIILKINNKDELDNLNINVSNSHEDSIGISLKTNKENESGSGKEKNSDTSTEAIKKNKKVFLQRLIEIPEKDDSKIDNSKMTDPIKQVDGPKDMKAHNQINENKPVPMNYKEENNESVFENKDVITKEEVKMNKLLKPFNKNLMRQLSRISEISNIISKGYDSNTGNSFDSNPLMKMRNKVKEVKENLNKYNVEEIELRKNLEVVNQTNTDGLSSDHDSASNPEGEKSRKEKENSEKLIINNEEDNKILSLEYIKTDQVESDKSRVPLQEVVHKTNSFEANESESQGMRAKEKKEHVKELDVNHNHSRSLSSNSSSKSSKKMPIKNSPTFTFERKNTIKTLLNTPSIKLMINKPKKGVRFSMINTILGENQEEKEKKTEESIELQRRKTEPFLPLSDQKSEKWVMEEMSQIHVNKKCEAELYKIFKAKKLKNLYKKFKYGIMNLYLKNQLIPEEEETEQYSWDIDPSLFPVNVRSNQAELLLSNYFNDAKIQSISLDYYLSKDFEPVKKDRINLFENFDIYSTTEFENTFKQLMSKTKMKEKEIINVKKRITFKETLKKTFKSVIKNDIPSLSLMNVIYFNKYLQLDLPENGVLEYADEQKKSKLIELKMRSNDNIQTLIKNDLLTPKLTAAVRRMSSLRLYDGALYHYNKKDEKIVKTNSSKSNKSKESSHHSSDEDSEVEEQELKDQVIEDFGNKNLTTQKKDLKLKTDKRKIFQKNSCSLKMQIKKPSDNEFIQNYMPQKFSILKNENFFEINEKMNTILPSEYFYLI
jgi:hypothetical protein